MLSYALVSYIVIMSITPGPNNLMLASSGVNFGFRRSVPHILGICIGHSVQFVITAWMLQWILNLLADWRLVLACFACAYLLYLSWKIFNSGKPEDKNRLRPMSFIGAAAFQWLNPKGWVMVINTAILFLPKNSDHHHILLLSIILSVVNLPCVAVWAWMGDRMRHFLNQERNLFYFNTLMAMLLSLTALYLLYSEYQSFMSASVLPSL